MAVGGLMLCFLFAVTWMITPDAPPPRPTPTEGEKGETGKKPKGGKKGKKKTE